MKSDEGVDAVLEHGGGGPFKGHLVNEFPEPPEITGFGMASTVPERGFYIAGETIRVRATFSAAVTETLPTASAAGATLTLRVGDREVEAEMQGTPRAWAPRRRSSTTR